MNIAKNITFALIGINVLIFALPMLGITTQDFIVQHFAKINSEISNGEFYRFITAAFLHADIAHLGMNMYSLYILATPTFQKFGLGGFGSIYLVSAITGTLASYLTNTSISLGASGAIFGLIGALLASALKSQNKFMIQQMLMIIGINVAFGLSVPNIDNMAHFGGLAGGFLVAMILPKR